MVLIPNSFRVVCPTRDLNFYLPPDLWPPLPHSTVSLSNSPDPCATRLRALVILLDCPVPFISAFNTGQGRKGTESASRVIVESYSETTFLEFTLSQKTILSKRPDRYIALQGQDPSQLRHSQRSWVQRFPTSKPLVLSTDYLAS